MTYEFCTLLDARYLPRGLVLYRSLQRTGADFHLRVFCMDDKSKRLLDRMALPQLTTIALGELEQHDAELLSVKPTRTQLEYYWTATPCVCRYALQQEPELGSITYLDADLMFFADPAPVFEELGSDSVLIVPHRYSPANEIWRERSGIYNVQFMTFRRDERGLSALEWWRERCIEWCYDRYEDGRFGDQKYLDDWPTRWEGVHVLQHPGAGLAPWNVEQYALERRDGNVLVDGRPLVFYHYHSLVLNKGPSARALFSNAYRRSRKPLPFLWTTKFDISTTERALIWEPYLRELGQAILDLREIEPGFDGGFVDTRHGSVRR